MFDIVFKIQIDGEMMLKILKKHLFLNFFFLGEEEINLFFFVIKEKLKTSGD